MPTLDYVTPKHLPASPAPARVMALGAWVCWLAPLTFGLLALLGYWLTGVDEFLYVGILVLMAGGLAAVVGLILAPLVFTFTTRVEEPVRHVLRRRAKISVAGIVLNFPIAFVCVILGAGLSLRVNLHVINNGSTPLTDIRLEVLGEAHDIGDLAPGERWSTSVSGSHGRAAVSWTDGAQRHEYVYAESADSDDIGRALRIRLSGSAAEWN